MLDKFFFISVVLVLGISKIYCELDLEAYCESRTSDGLDFYRNPEDCNSYITCDEDPYIGYCAEDNYFDEEAQSCDEKENVQCDGEINPEPETTTTSTTTTTTTTTEAPTTTSSTPETSIIITTTEIPVPTTGKEVSSTTSKITVSEPSTTTSESSSTPAVPALEECPAGNKNAIFIASKTSCSEYYFCYDGVSTLMKCATNLYFNPEKSKCDFKDNVNCSTGKPKCSKNENGFFPHETSCKLFYFCSGGVLSVQQCPYFYYWNADEKECQLKVGIDC